jgi:hypothetical protein
MGKISVSMTELSSIFDPRAFQITTLPPFFACELVTLDRLFIWMRHMLRINFDSADQNIWMNREEMHFSITWVFTVSLYVVKPKKGWSKWDSRAKCSTFRGTKPDYVIQNKGESKVNTLKPTVCSNYCAQIHRLYVVHRGSHDSLPNTGDDRNLNDCLMQICAPWWWVSEAQKV